MAVIRPLYAAALAGCDQLERGSSVLCFYSNQKLASACYSPSFSLGDESGAQASAVDLAGQPLGNFRDQENPLRYLVIRENVGRMYSQLVSWVDSMATLRLSLTVCGIPSTWGGSVWMTRHSYKALIQRFRAALDPALYAKTLIGVDGVLS
jgi:hypothetical protein